MKILGTGLTGLVGSRVVELLKDTYEFEQVSRSSGVDITQAEQIGKAIHDSPAEIVLHLAAKTDVDGSEKDHLEAVNDEAWNINVKGTQHVASACLETGKKLLYISTDFVFDGEKDSYTEEDTPHPLNWYAQTKYAGEQLVSRLTTPWLILRVAYPYRAEFTKNDFVRAVKSRLEKHEPVTMVTDHIFVPTFIDDIANAIQRLLTQNQTGLFHVVGSQALSPFDAAKLIAQTYGYDESLISETTREEYFKNKATRPFHLALKNDKIGHLGIKMRTFEEGLIELKSQIQ